MAAKKKAPSRPACPDCGRRKICWRCKEYAQTVAWLVKLERRVEALEDAGRATDNPRER